MRDLFGEELERRPVKTFEQEYQEYIASARWRRVRDAKLKAVGSKCERCGVSKWSKKLEVHHLNYEHFRHERLDDLRVLCEDCHKKADKERETQTRLRQSERLYDARLDGWATKVYGSDWQDGDTELIADEFYLWLENREEE